MKKTLLSIGAALLFGFGAMAGGITSTGITLDNAYQEAGQLQAAQAGFIPGTPLALNQIIKVEINNAISDRDFDELQVTVVDEAEEIGYFGKFSETFVIAEDVKAGTAFSGIVLIPIKYMTQTDPTKPAGDLHPAAPSLIIAGKDATITEDGPSAWPVTPTIISEITATITVTNLGVLNGELMPKSQDKNQSAPLLGYMPATFAVGDQFTVTVKGKTNVAASDFQVAVIDTRATALPKNYFSELTVFSNLDGVATAGADFEVSGVIEITALADPESFENAAKTLVLTAVSEADVLAIENLEITVTPYEGGTDPTDPDQPTAIDGVESAKVSVKSSAIEVSSEKAIVSVVVTNVAGVQVVNQAVGATSATVSTADLQAGVYYAVINFANGSVQVVKFVK